MSGEIKQVPSEPDWEDLDLSVLKEAFRVVHKDRQADYGTPSNNHGTTATMMQAFLSRKYGRPIPFDAEDVCFFHILEKCSRDANKPKRDNIVDIPGYAENINMIRMERGIDHD